MRKIVGIYDCNFVKKDYDEKPGCLGGSETWTIELVNHFINMNYYVILFCVTDSVDLKNNMEFYPTNLLAYRTTYTKFDYYISSRTTTGIIDSLVADKIYVMCHDMLLIDVKYNSFDLKLDRVNKYCFISNYQLDNFKLFYKSHDTEIPDDKTMIIGNGVNQTLYLNREVGPKKNQMVFSSRPERGLLQFVKNIFPKIKEAVPDFVLKVCHYGGNDERYEQIKGIDGIEFVGRLEKQELADLQLESNIWIYIYDEVDYKGFRETFCITALENGYAENAMVTVTEGAIPEIFEGYELIYDISDYESVANKAIELLKNEDMRRQYAFECNEIATNYTWDGISMLWDLEFKS